MPVGSGVREADGCGTMPGMSRSSTQRRRAVLLRDLERRGLSVAECCSRRECDLQHSRCMASGEPSVGGASVRRGRGLAPGPSVDRHVGFAFRSCLTPLCSPHEIAMMTRTQVQLPEPLVQKGAWRVELYGTTNFTNGHEWVG